MTGPSTGSSFRHKRIWQLTLMIVLLIVWEIAGRATGSEWITRPSLVAVKIADWAGSDLYAQLGTTIGEVAAGMLIGVPLGAAVGVLLGAGGWWGRLLRPMVVIAYSVPLVTLAPLLIMWFGIEMQPKIVLIATVSFFLVFFYAFSGAQSVDRDMIDAVSIIGGRRDEVFRKVVLPSCTSWILAGVKVVVPYALVAAVTGEMLAARRGLGLLIAQGAAQFDMVAVYAALFILALVGLALAEGFAVVERYLMRWRNAS